MIHRWKLRQEIGEGGMGAVLALPAALPRGWVPEVELFEVVAIVAAIAGERAIGELLRVDGNRKIRRHATALSAPV